MHYVEGMKIIKTAKQLSKDGLDYIFIEVFAFFDEVYD